MDILITKDSRGIVADCTDMPGSPPIGIGPNKAEAVADLFVRLLHSEGFVRILLKMKDENKLWPVKITTKDKNS